MKFTTKTDFYFEIVLLFLIGTLGALIAGWENGHFAVISGAIGMYLGRLSADKYFSKDKK